MTTAIKRRRGTTSQHSTFTGLEGEITVDTTKDTLVVHDGSTAGGFPLLRQDLSNNTNVSTLSNTQTLSNKTINLSSNTLTGTIAQFNTALTDADFATLDGTETLSNKTFSTNPTISAGTANGVAYLNGSKVLTTGSVLTFDGLNGGTTGSWQVGNLISIGGGYIRVNRSDNNTYNEIKYATGDLFYFNQANGGAYQFNISGSEQMRLTNTGLGIGTTSPGAKLDIVTPVAASTPAAIFRAASGVGNSGGLGLYANTVDANARNWYMVANSNAFGDFVFKCGASQGADPTVGTSILTLNSSGNLGLGVTPSAWGSGYKAIDISGGGAITSLSNNLYLTANAYDNSGWKYKANGYATLDLSINGEHRWFTAPSGTAGNAISFTQAMTLDASGNLGLGTAAPADPAGYGGKILDVYGPVYARQSSDSTKYFAIGAAGGTAYLNVGGSIPLATFVGGSERMRIDSSGNLLVGTTSQSAGGVDVKVHISGNQYGLGISVPTTGAQQNIRFVNGTTAVGSVTTSSTATTYGTSSDYRLKENIQPMQGALGVVAQLNPVTYNWKADGSDGQGFIAHELQAVVPDCVTGEKDAVDEEGKPVYQGIDTSFLVATLCKAIQEQQEQINQLKAEVAALKGN